MQGAKAMSLLDHYAEQLDQFKQQGNFRQFTSNQQQGRWITIQDRTMLNLASNDYLGLAADLSLREEFLDTLKIERASSSSSRLLTGILQNMNNLKIA
jgi:8-amino-7-oxononanoate synthase